MSSKSRFPGENLPDKKLGPVVSTLPAAGPDGSAIPHGSLVTLEPWSVSNHWTSFWRNLQLLENPWLMDYFSFDEVYSEEDMLKQVAHAAAEPDVILYAVLADPACLTPTKGTGGMESSVRHIEVLGFIAYSLAGAMHREIEIGALFAPALS